MPPVATEMPKRDPQALIYSRWPTNRAEDVQIEILVDQVFSDVVVLVTLGNLLGKLYNP